MIARNPKCHRHAAVGLEAAKRASPVRSAGSLRTSTAGSQRGSSSGSGLTADGFFFALADFFGILQWVLGVQATLPVRCGDHMAGPFLIVLDDPPVVLLQDLLRKLSNMNVSPGRDRAGPPARATIRLSATARSARRRRSGCRRADTSSRRCAAISA